MAQFSYVDTEGKTQTVEAESADVALNTASNIAPTSGVQLMKDFNNFQSTNKEPVSPNDLGGGVPELGTQTTSKTDRAAKNITASGLDLQAQADLLASGQATEDDLLALEGQNTKRFLDIIQGLGGKGDREAELRKEEGISGLKMEAQEYINQLDAEKRALDIAKRELYSNGGLTKNQLDVRSRELTRMSLQKQADIAILGNAAMSRLDVARDNVQERLDLEFGAREEELELFTQQFNAISGLSKTVRDRLAQETADEKAALKENRANKQALLELAIEAANNGNQAFANRLMQMANEETVSFEDVQNAQAQAISAGVYTQTSGTGGTLDILDSQRYNDSYPGLGIVPGMSEAEADRRVAEYTNDPIGYSVENMKKSGDSFEDAISAKQDWGLTPVQAEEWDRRVREIYNQPKAEQTASTGGFLNKISSMFTRTNKADTQDSNDLFEEMSKIQEDYEPLDLGIFSSFYKK